MAGAVALVWSVAGCVGGASGDPAPASPPSTTVRQVLDARVVDLVEHRFPQIITFHRNPIACAARTFGTDPETAADASDVSIAYAWLYCEEELPGGGTGDQATVPVAAHLVGTPRVEAPSSGEVYPADVDRIFPRSLRGTAIKPPTYVADVITAVANQRSAAAPAPSPS
ncbi:MAG: hypothetical protein J2P15_14465 [Micromonosporaceae bacterium]|nr:hypothetical protein [Micromonosporaceae bacterium]